MRVADTIARVRSPIAKAVLPTLLLLIALLPREAQAACYVAFVHGHMDAPPTGNPEAYWNPEVTPSTPIGTGGKYYSFTQYAGVVPACKIARVTWNSTWSFKNRAYEVANQLNDFVTRENIPDGELVIIAHSMGGLVTRFLLNNAFPGSIFYRSSWSSLPRKTKYIITVQTPHGGAKAADALANEAGDVVPNLVASVAQTLGFASRDAGTDSMRRIEMEYASASGGWMGDAFRTAKIYIVQSNGMGFLTPSGQYASGPYAAPGETNTGNLENLWAGLCYVGSTLNQFLCNNGPYMPGDGMVESRSSSGNMMRGGRWDGSRYAGYLFVQNYSTDPNSNVCSLSNPACKSWNPGVFMAGSRVSWMRYNGNHDQGRYDRWQAPIKNFSTGESTTNYPASYIGSKLSSLTR